MYKTNNAETLWKHKNATSEALADAGPLKTLLDYHFQYNSSHIMISITHTY